MVIPYLGPPAHTSAGSNLPPTRIVIHATVSPCRAGQARATAAYFRSPSAGGSAHYVADPGEVVQVAQESVVCWHAPPNAHSIGVELCDPQTGPADRWADADHEAMLRRAADIVRDIAARHNIPVEHIGPADLLAGKRGICGHVDVTNAWHQTTHVDPGDDFPWSHFLDLVRATTTTPTPTQEDDMPYTPEQIGEAAGSGVLGAKIGRTGLTVGVVLDRLYSSAQAEQVQNAALAEAVKSLAAAKGVDGDALIAAVRADVQAALKDVTITLTTGA